MKCRYRIMKTKLLSRVRTKNGTVDKVKVNSADLIELLKQEFFTVDSTTVQNLFFVRRSWFSVRKNYVWVCINAFMDQLWL